MNKSKDRSMELNVGKFLDNGNCGFVLKPKYMIQDAKPIPVTFLN